MLNRTPSNRPARRPLASLSIPLLAALLAAGAAQATEIGYVDMERVLQESALGKAAQEKLQEQFGDEQQQFAEEEMAIRQLQQQLERDRPLMSKAQVEKKQQEIQGRIEKFEAAFAEIQQELMQAQQEAGSTILEPARNAVIAVAKEKKLGAVLEANQSGVMYLDDSANITEAVIEAMDKASK